MDAFRNVIAVASAILGLSACAALTTEDRAELCEIEVSNNHRDAVMWFHQDLSQAEKKRDFTCSLSLKWSSVDAASAVPLLQPWCRDTIQQALSASLACSGTQFSRNARDIALARAWEQDAEGDSVLVLRGSVDVVRHAN